MTELVRIDTYTDGNKYPTKPSIATYRYITLMTDPKQHLIERAKGFDIEGFVNDVAVGSNALKEEAEDTLVKKFIALEKKNAKKSADQTKKVLTFFDKFAGFGKFKFDEVTEVDGKVNGAQGLGDTKTAVKPKELQALQKGSAEAFRAINRKADPAINLAKKQLAVEERQEKQLKKIVANGKNNAIITVVPA